MLADLVELIRQSVRDDANLITVDDIGVAAGLAVARYSLDRPREIVEDLAPSGTDTLPLPTLWQDDFSHVVSVEYPFGLFPPEFLDNDLHLVYQAPTGKVFRLGLVPTSGVRATYTIAHTLNDTVDTLPIKHREAIACWAAAFCYDQLAGYYAGATDTMMQADSVRRNEQSRDYAKRAETLRKRYINELGLEDKKNAAAGMVVDLDLKTSYGTDRFTHRNRFR